MSKFLENNNEYEKEITVPGESKFSIENMDLTVDPSEDFNRYANGKWIDSNPVPADKTSWGTFNELYDRNNYLLREIAERCSKSQGKNVTMEERLVGDFYKSAMDTKTIEALKTEPIKAFLKEIGEIKGKDDLIKYVYKLHSSGIPAFFRSSSRGDKKNSSIYSLYFMQGGISLPNRDYYIKDSFKGLKEEYPKHIDRILKLAGLDEYSTGKCSQAVLNIEEKIALKSRSQEDLRDQEKNYNRIEISKLEEDYPSLRLLHYMNSLEIPEVDYVIMGQPEFFKFLDQLLVDTTIDDLKSYLIWNIVNFAAPFLNMEMQEEHFDFFNRKIMGQQKMEPRWKRSVNIVNFCIGDALGKLYIQDHFGEESRKRMEVLIDDIKSIFRERLLKLTWMGDETKKRALEKFDRFRAKIGYPVKWKDYSSIHINDRDYFGNVLRSIEFEVKRQAARVGKPVDRDEWFMTPPTVNAYFSPTDNEIVFPAGILQPPFFDVTMDDAVNYGSIGAVISHEITHGYDDQGRMYDEEGNLRDWWTERDRSEFMKKAQAVIDLYSSQEILPGVKVHGDLTVGENIADFGGVSIAFAALERRLRINPELRKEIDGFTPEQRFFISWAQIWKENIREEELKRRVIIDPHAPNKLRASLPVWNHPSFEETFSVKKTSTKEGRREKIPIW
jgi:predicted metalloendopeptidase